MDKNRCFSKSDNSDNHTYRVKQVDYDYPNYVLLKIKLAVNKGECECVFVLFNDQ